MPHFRPWPSHSCRRSPLFSEQDAPSPVPCPLPTPTPSLARAPGSQLQKNLRPAPRPEHPFSPPVGTPVECPSMPGSSRGLRPRRGSTPGARAHVSRHAWPRRCVRGPLSWDQSPGRQHSRGRRLGHREPVLLVYPASPQSPPLRGTAQGRSWPAPWPLTSLPLPRSGCIPHTSSGPREGLGGGGRAAP